MCSGSSPAQSNIEKAIPHLAVRHFDPEEWAQSNLSLKSEFATSSPNICTKYTDTLDNKGRAYSPSSRLGEYLNKCAKDAKIESEAFMSPNLIWAVLSKNMNIRLITYGRRNPRSADPESHSIYIYQIRITQTDGKSFICEFEFSLEQPKPLDPYLYYRTWIKDGDRALMYLNQTGMPVKDIGNFINYLGRNCIKDLNDCGAWHEMEYFEKYLKDGERANWQLRMVRLVSGNRVIQLP